MTTNLTNYSKFIHKSRYARYIETEQRRESWEETVDRLVSYLKTKTKVTIPWDELRQSIVDLEVMPSMRLLMTAGDAVERDNIAAYNCSYLAINNKRAFSEALYILMNGTGVGFSCERQEIDKLPPLPSSFKEVDDVISVADSKLGWAKAFKKLVSSLWEGDIPKVDYSKVRPAGARLKTFGGRASGPDPLRKLFKFTMDTCKGAAGRKLNSLEVHDILCMIGEIVVVGGVRRSALISLSNLTDKRMRDAKTGAWYNDYPYRGLANNSVAYTENPIVKLSWKSGSVWLSPNQVNEEYLIELLLKIKQQDGDDEIQLSATEPIHVQKLSSVINSSATLRKWLYGKKIPEIPYLEKLS